jgi:uncharacterized membrane protein
VFSDPAVLESLRWPLEVLSLLALLAQLIYLRLRWSSLPEKIPMHFGITGKPDRWHGRWSLLLFAAISIGLYVTMTIVSGTFQQLMGRQSSDAGEALFIAWLKTVMLLMFGFCVWTSIRVATGQAERMNVIAVILFVLAAMAPALLRGYAG